MSEYHGKAVHENIPFMGDLDSDINGMLTWKEYSSDLQNHVKQLIAEEEVKQRERVGKDRHPLSVDKSA